MKTKLSLVLLLIPFALHRSFATPIFVLDSPAAFSAAINDGRLQPAFWDATMESIFPGLEPSFRSPTLSVDSTGLLVDFSIGPSDELPLITAFDYVYPVDPDMTSTRIQKQNKVPAAPFKRDWIITLIDTNGKKKMWDIEFPADSDIDESIDLQSGGGQQGTDSFKEDAGFDLSKVTRFRQIVEYKVPAVPVVPLPGQGAFRESFFAVTHLPDTASSLYLLSLAAFALSCAKSLNRSR